MPLTPWAASLALLGLNAVTEDGPPTLQPDSVLLGVPGDPSTSFGVSWRARPETGAGWLEWRMAGRPETAKRVEAGFADVWEGRWRTRSFSAEVFGAAAGAQVEYRVAAGDRQTPWQKVRLASADPKPFRFIWLGDAQSIIKERCTPVFEAAHRAAPDAAFVLHAGDLIDTNTSYGEWAEWHYAARSFAAATPSLSTPGNHEYGRPGRFKGLSPYWRPAMVLPVNGPKGMEETAWWMDWQGLRIISLDSLKPTDEQVEWMKGLPNWDKVQWTIASTHYPIFPALTGQEMPGRTAKLQKAFEELGVNLVLTGHHHSYARSGLVLGRDFDAPQGVMYAVSVAGPKFYRQDKMPWMKVGLARTQTYQVIDVGPEALTYRAFTQDGAEVDSVTITRDQKLPGLRREP